MPLSLRGLPAPPARAVLALASLVLCLAPAALGAVTVQPMGPGLTAANLAQSLVGAGISISNVTYQGVSVASGTFAGGLGAFGIDSGVILTCGSVYNAPGPNNDSGKSSSNGAPGDADLDLASGYSTHDASVLEFDFVPQSGEVRFEFVFGSEEYPEFVTSFNDAFAIYVNGVNVAKVPGTGLPVSIFTISPINNTSYYVDNTGAVRDVQLDGFTKVLTADSAVNIGVSNHIKFAVADAVDDQLDTMVFIKAGSLTAFSPTPTRSATRTATPSFSASPTRTATLTATPSATQSPVLSPTPTATISPTWSPSPTSTISFTHSITPTYSHSPTKSPTPSVTPTFSASPTASPTPTVTPTASPSPTASPTPTVTPTFSASPTASPTGSPTPSPTATPKPLLLTPHRPNPNPGSTDIWLPYSISTDADVDLKIYDVAGETVRRFDPVFLREGTHETRWDLRNEAGQRVASGVFLVRVRAVSPAGEHREVWMKCAVSR